MRDRDEGMRSRRKIRFHLEQDEDGWPPSTVETVWAKDLGQGLYEIDNIPFFVRGIAYGDVVLAERFGGELTFKELRRTSGHSTIRIVFHDPSFVKETCAALERLGCSWEGSHLPSLVSVDIPPSSSYEIVRTFLDEGEASEKWEYEEGCLGFR